jgi:hypothetical protein
MIKIKKNANIRKIKVHPDSIGAKLLIKMVEHQRLRHAFYRGEISLDELNQELLAKEIYKKYDYAGEV